VCREYKLACLKWCCQLLPCFNGKLHLVYWWKMFIVSALSNTGAWNQASRNPKTQPPCKWCVLVHWLAGRCKSQSIPTSVWNWSFKAFCGCNGKNSSVCHQWTRWSSPSKQDSYSATAAPVVTSPCLYSRHIMTPALHHDWQRIFN